MGFYTNFRDPMARREIVRYYGFLRENDALYHANRPYSEVVLLYPRRSVHEGDVAPVDRFKRLGRLLLDRHVLFDIVPDDLATPARLAAYRQVLTVSAGDGEGERAVADLSGTDISRFEAPWTVRVSASRPAAGGEVTVHFVNYDRTEPKEKRSAGSGIVDERPRPVSGIGPTSACRPVPARPASWSFRPNTPAPATFASSRRRDASASPCRSSWSTAWLVWA